MSGKTPAKTAKQIQLFFATMLLLSKEIVIKDIVIKNIVSKKYKNQLTVSGLMENYWRPE
ncbi:hypothetical protein TCT1_35780 [Xenorhabdus sp. TCT-1]|uniref:Transposase n=1 Tax=Xenorhabdus taiwanensis TaxID=3085177 RepID=A0ABM8K105_9GAMM|nr:hypothetical protein TCT1_35780 [Xenorhabdus sp. TCT-1]